MILTGTYGKGDMTKGSRSHAPPKNYGGRGVDPSRELLRWRTIGFRELLLSENYYGIRDPGILVERYLFLAC